MVVEEKVMWNKTGASTDEETQSKRGVSTLLGLLDGMAARVESESGTPLCVVGSDCC